jgi:hypothetical protein
MLVRLQETMGRLALQVTKVEEALNSRQRALMESHLTESRLWKSRCDEKNRLIELLARRIAHMSITDMHGYFINAVLREICKVGDEIMAKSRIRHSSLTTTRNSIGSRGRVGNETKQLHDFTCDSLRLFLTSERRRIMVIFTFSNHFALFH